jgi:hypothetical protein
MKVSLPFFQLNQQATTTTLLFIVERERCKMGWTSAKEKKRKEEFLQFA